MTLGVALDGSPLVNRVRLRTEAGDGIDGLSASADGVGSQGGLIFDDEFKTLTVQGWMHVKVTESDCANSVLFNGYVADRNTTRGPYRGGPGRQIDTTINDSNVLLSLRLIDRADGKRGKETDIARIDWILANYLTHLVVDVGWVNRSNPRMMDEADYRGQYAADVLSDISGPRGQIFFAQWDHDSGTVGLFYDQPTAYTGTSPLSISNVISDVEADPDCYYPSVDAALNQDPSELYSRLRYVSKAGALVTNNPTTAATYFPWPLVTRGWQVENTRVGLMSTAQTFSDRLLAVHSTENDTITVTIIVPSSKVGLVDAGQRISCRFLHLDGMESFVYRRISSRTYRQVSGNRKLYEVALTLNGHGLSGGGGGGAPPPGDFPHPPAGPPALVQSKTRVSTSATPVVLDSAPGEGGLLVAVVGWRSAAGPLLDGFTQVGSTVVSAGGLDNLMLQYRITQAGDTATLAFTAGAGLENVAIVSEWTGSWSSPLDVTGSATGTGVTPSKTITPTSGKSAVIIGGAVNTDTNTPQDTNYVAGAGWTLIGQANVPAGHPVVGAVYQTVASTTGSYSPNLSATSGYPGDGSASTWAAIAASFVQDGEAAPPSPGQHENGDGSGEIVTMTGPSGTTRFPFADGSLRVFVDNTDQTAALIYQDGECGDFTLGFTPTPTEVVKVFYQGR